MRLKDLHLLPKIRDSWSYLYVEHCTVEQDQKSISIFDKTGVTAVPCASLALLMLGPGSKITHAAVLTLADNGCLVVWCGEQGVRFYASGMGETRQARNLLHQARLCTHPETRLAVAKRMYWHRFAEEVNPALAIEQLRGKEGVRVREAYARASRETGVPWSGRSYDRGDWNKADPVNRALSCANSCLYGICHAAIVSLGLSPGLGFIHTGKQRSFVFDIADLYKVDITIPVAFRVTAAQPSNLEREVRLQLRDAFAASRLLARIADDIMTVLDVEPEPDPALDFDADPALPGPLWDPDVPGGVPGGTTYADADNTSEEF